MDLVKEVFEEKKAKLDDLPRSSSSDGGLRNLEGVKKAPDLSDTANQSSVSTKFLGLTLEDLLFIEIFAGTARLSKAAKAVGFQTLPIDKTTERASQIYIAQYDLSDDEAVNALMDVIRAEKHRIVAVHIAPACGTASRAREKKLTKFARQGFKIPIPLRSQQQPLGVSALAGLDKIRTESANLVYAATAQIVELCVQLSILCSIENPENSLFWCYPDIEKIIQQVTGHSVSFHNCMHGGNRKKLTKWWATDRTYESLRLICDDVHSHAQWNPKAVGQHLSFPTAEEAAYPMLLCKRIMSILVQYAIFHGAIQVNTLDHQLPIADTTSHRWILNMLPKGKKLKPLVSEFRDYVHFLNQLHCEPETSACFQRQLKGSRIVDRRIQWGRLRVEMVDGVKISIWESDQVDYRLELDTYFLEKAGQLEQFQAELCTIGIPRDPWDFLQRAIQVGHPRTIAVHLNSEVKIVLQENFAGDLHELVKARATYLLKWTKRCEELEADERKLHETLAPHLKQVLRGKRLLVFQEMLNDLGYPDKNLVQDICGGFKLSGWLPKSGVFPATLKRPSHNMETAKRLAKGLNHSICKQVAGTGDDSLEAEVWRQTEEEVEKGWTWFDEDCNLDDKLLAKRFGLLQGEKTRLIDDCTIGGFNGTCGAREKLKVQSIDEMAAYLAWCLTNLPNTSMNKVLGKTYDLKNAYKQYGIHPQDREVLRLAVWDPNEQKVKLLGANALPFGAVGSVGAFLRVSTAIWFIGMRGFRLCWTSFFDDFTMLSRAEAARSAALSAESLLKLLGVQFAEEGKKAVSWSTSIKTLGVQLDLEHMGTTRQASIGHTESRVEELKSFIDKFLETGTMSRKDAERLRGRLQWYESFANGRVAQQALRVVSNVASIHRRGQLLSDMEIKALKFLRLRVLNAPPTIIQSTNLRTWLIFSDGACEGEDRKRGSIGAILVDPEGNIFRYFSEVVPEKLMDRFLEQTQHPIFELELLPVWCALYTWSGFLQNSQAVFYLDNEGAKAALINGATSTENGRLIIQQFVLRELQIQMRVWFSRVPTSSNLADAPSRLECEELDSLGVTRNRIEWEAVQSKLEEAGSKEWGFETGSSEISPLA